MVDFNNLTYEIALFFAEQEKSYDLPSVCMKYGLEDGEEAEAFKSKRVYVQRRLKGKDQLLLSNLAKKIVSDYGAAAFSIRKLLNNIDSNSKRTISEITRRNIMDELCSKGNIEGKMEPIDFLKRTWDLDNMPSQDTRYGNATSDIEQHMINNFDFDDSYLYDNYLSLIKENDELFIYFLEQVVHPLVRPQDELPEFIQLLNSHLKNDGYKLSVTDHISNYPVFTISKIEGGVKGAVKNLIFASVGPKPEIIISDSINNDIKIVKNEEFCLVFDRPISNSGLLWGDLVDWWASFNETDKSPDLDLYGRLFKSLDSPPERMLFYNYFSLFSSKLDTKLPALIPQVYLHYDPYTIKQRLNENYLPRQRMDFLLLFSNKQRVVLELDGKQHYSDGDISSPRKYSKMVNADRDLRLNGYEVYRFGGHEFLHKDASLKTIKDFFERLFKKHGT